MQIFIAKTLNKLLVLFSAVIILLFGGIFLASRFYPDYVRWHLLVFIIVSVTLALLYRYLEENWDKKVIMRMAQNGKIALFTVRSGKRLMGLRDTSFRTYWIYELEGDLYNAKHEKLEKTFREKMNRKTSGIPEGSFYVTYDEQKPSQLFIIPNVLIGSLPNLMKTVEGYEKDKTLSVTYLDAHYDRGIVLKTFKETMADYNRAKTEQPGGTGTAEKAETGT